MKVRTLAVIGACLFSLNAASYEYATGKMFVRGVVGATVNVYRYDAIALETTPGAGLLLGVEGEYVIANPWSVSASFRPGFAPGFIDMGFGVGGKYRWNDLGVPLSVSLGVELTPAILVPLSRASSHFNLGVRTAVGVDYFVMNDLVLGAQVAFEPGVLLTERFRSFEASLEVLFGATYKI